MNQTLPPVEFLYWQSTAASYLLKHVLVLLISII